MSQMSQISQISQINQINQITEEQPQGGKTQIKVTGRFD